MEYSPLKRLYNLGGAVKELQERDIGVGGIFGEIVWTLLQKRENGREKSAW